VDNGYIHHQRSKTDRRSVRVRLTPKGKEVYSVVNGLFERQLTMIEKVAGLSVGDLKVLNQSLGRLERFWGDQIRYRL
jgi:DNA-binding MarR family transcriptional regulator